MNHLVKLSLFCFFIGRSAAFVLPPAGILKGNDFPELQYLNESVDPCDDFYEFSCGNFPKIHPMPNGEKMWDPYYILQRQIDDISLGIVKSEKLETDPPAVRKVKDLFHACVNTDKYDGYYGERPMTNEVMKLGGWPLLATSKRSTAAFSWNEVGDIVAEHGLPLFISWGLGQFTTDADQFMLILQKDSLSLPSSIIAAEKDFEQLQAELFEQVILDRHTRQSRQDNPYVSYVVQIAKAVCKEINCHERTEDIREGVQQVLDLMVKISQSTKTPDREVKFNKTINNIEDLQEWTDSFSRDYKTRIDWLQFFQRAFKTSEAVITKDTKVYLLNPKSMANILDLVESTSSAVLKNFIISRLTSFMAPDSSLTMWEAYNSLYKQQYGDKYPIFGREDYCKRKIINSPQMAMALSYDYYTYFFDNRKIHSAEGMIDDLKASFTEQLMEKDWIDEAGKAAAKEKLRNMINMIGFPDFVFDETSLNEYFSKFVACRHDNFGNMQRLRNFNFRRAVGVIGNKRDRNLWTNSPMTVNAFYNPQNNRIVFPAAIMNAPFFAGQYSVLDYARMGSLIGHEITHGFDSNGMQLNGEGSFAPIFSKNVSQVFNEKANCFVEQYSSYYINEIEKYVNGIQTLRENIADNGGLREAYRAFLKAFNRENGSFSTDKYNAEQLFFIAFGTNWCKIDTLESLNAMYDDPHAPNRFRVRGTVSNLDEFSKAFSCKKGSKMNPENKCILW